ncbi:MAG: hypothetical protein F7C08_01140 [Desulfurococcales archaeon]|nr:hypothetical protein [Desulfurococcales archaeon]MCE4605125.1 hypothetical protein [Desulfurococcales archaeon]
MLRASAPLLLLSLLLLPLAYAKPEVVVYSEPPIQGLTVDSIESIEYRGRYYPKLSIRLPSNDGCPNVYIVEVWKDQLNITRLALASGSINIDYDSCTLDVDGYRLKGIMYLDGPSITIIVNIDGITTNIVIKTRETVVPVRGNHTNTDPRADTADSMPVSRSSLPTETINNTFSSLEILVGITLVALLAVSVVYEYALGRGGRVAEIWKASDDLRRRQ